MISYYLYMGLLIVTLVLWGVIAFRDEAPPDEAPPGGGEDDKPS